MFVAGRGSWPSHEGEDGPNGLSVAGEVPRTLAEIQKEMEDLQLAEGGDDAGVDHIFEIPFKVAQSLLGFKHDEDPAHLISTGDTSMSCRESRLRRVSLIDFLSGGANLRAGCLE